MEDFLANLNSQYQAMCDLVVDWAKINSFSTNITGIAKLAQSVKQEFSVLTSISKEIPVSPWHQFTVEGETINHPLHPVLLFQKRPHAARQILLCGHLDTVYPPESSQTITWLNSKTLQGPGVTDMKGGLVAMLFALKALEKSNMANELGWQVVLNADEEIGSPGSTPILMDVGKLAQLALLFEPAVNSAGNLASNRKGSGKLTLIVQGRAAHAGRSFHEGRNAIVMMAEVIQKISNLNSTKKNFTLNVGKIQGGNAVNVVPEWCMSEIDLRVDDLTTGKQLLNHLQKIIDEFNQRPDYRLALKGELNRPPKIFDPKTQQLFAFIAKTADSLKQTIAWQATGGVCDGNNLAQLGIPVADTLGVCGEGIHSPNEKLFTPSLVSRAQLIAAVLFRLARGEGDQWLC